MTDSTPDDKTPAEDATPEETASSSTDSANAEASADTVAARPAQSAGVTESAAPKKRRRVIVEEYDDDELDALAEDENTEVVRRPARTRTPKFGVGRSAAPRGGGAVAASSGGPRTLLTILVTVLVVALLLATIAFGFLWLKNRSDLNNLRNAEADRAHAEKVASDYAVTASTFNYQDLGGWATRMTANVSDDLKKRLDASTSAINQLLQPLQWTSTGTSLDSVVNSESGPIYKVSAYVRVQATNLQTPGGRQTVSVFNVTVNKDANWQITSVGDAVEPESIVNGGSSGSAAPSASAAPTETAAPTTEGAAPAAPTTEAPATTPAG